MHERNEAPYMAASCMLNTRLLRARLAWIVGRAPKRDDVRGPWVCMARVVRIARKRNAREQ
eukprot:7300404-Prymnesium_polylepis.1